MVFRILKNQIHLLLTRTEPYAEFQLQYQPVCLGSVIAQYK